MDGEFRIAAQVEDVDFAYVPPPAASAASARAAPEWPAFAKVRGELVFDRADDGDPQCAGPCLRRGSRARCKGGIRSLVDKPVLAIEGVARGPLADMLRYVNASPVGSWIDKALAQSTVTGNTDLTLGLSIPLTDAGASTVKGSVVLAGNDVRIAPDTPVLLGEEGASTSRTRASASSVAPLACSAETPPSTAARSPMARCDLPARASSLRTDCDARRKPARCPDSPHS
jgi:uncharacterized protein YhdP